MQNSYRDIPNYLKIFRSYLGRKIYIIFVLSTIAGLAEGVGIVMVLPLLQNIGQSQEHTLNKSVLSDLANSALSSIGLQGSLIGLLLLITFAFMIKALMAFGALALNVKLCCDLLRLVKTRLFDAYNLMSYRYYISRDTGYFVNMIGQVGGLISGFTNLTQFITQSIYAFIYLLFAFMVAWKFGLMALISGIILLLLFRALNSKVRLLSRDSARESTSLEHLLIQAIQSFKYLRSTDLSSRTRPRILESISQLTNQKLKVELAAVFTQSIREPLSVVLIVSIILFQIQVLAQPIEPVLVSIILFHRGLNAFIGIQNTWQATLAGIGNVELVHEEFMRQNVMREPSGDVPVKNINFQIEFRDVSFSYTAEEQKAIKDLSLTIPAKTSVALIGQSGSGKSTIVDLITLMLRPTAGTIFFDGTCHNDVDVSSWRSRVGYVGQEAIVFDDTIANNICLWDNTKGSQFELMQKIRAAAEQAYLLDFVESLPEGFSTRVGERGVRLSGGQRQRLSIARELYRDPSFLILDEATSALDTESEREIQKSIDRLKGNITVLIIAHRLSTIKNVDRIYVIEHGQIIEAGSFEELRDTPSSRLSKFIRLQQL